MIRLCGGTLALFAFSVTLLLGLSAGNAPEVVLQRAVTALFIFCGLGLAVGWVGSRILDEHAIARNRELFPPEEEASEGHQGDASGDDGAGTAAAAG